MREARHDSFFSCPEQASIFPEAVWGFDSAPATDPEVTDKTQ